MNDQDSNTSFIHPPPLLKRNRSSQIANGLNNLTQIANQSAKPFDLNCLDSKELTQINFAIKQKPLPEQTNQTQLNVPLNPVLGLKINLASLSQQIPKTLQTAPLSQEQEIVNLRSTVKSLEFKVLEQDKNIKELQNLMKNVIDQVNTLKIPQSAYGRFLPPERVISEEDSSLSRSDSISQLKRPNLSVKVSLQTLSESSNLLRRSDQSLNALSLSQSRSTVNFQRAPRSFQPDLNRTSQNFKDEGLNSDEEFFEVKEERADIVFLYSEALAYKTEDNQIKPMRWEQTLSPQVMYNQLVKELGQRDLKFTKSHLNKETLQRTIDKKPKVIIINCHGDFDQKTQQYFFWFEDTENPSLVDKFDQKRLSSMFEIKENRLELVVISACHSSAMAEIIYERGAKNVVSINSSARVLEKAAQIFNKEFFHNLFSGKTVEDAFSQGKKSVKCSKDQINKICCCEHLHKPECLWLKYQHVNGSEAAHKLHSPACSCYKNQQTNIIDHGWECPGYKTFYNQLQKHNSSDFTQDDGLGLPLPPLSRYEKNETNKLCCCQPDLIHDESQKFVLFNDQQSVVNKMFDSPIAMIKQKSKFSDEDTSIADWICRNRDTHFLFERNLEVHSVVDFLYHKDKRFLVVQGQEMIGRGQIIKKAIHFSLERDRKLFLDDVFKVDLEGVSSIKAAVVKISETLKLANPDPDENSLIKDLKQQNSLIFFQKCKFLESADGQKKLINLFNRIVKDSQKVKIIVYLKELTAKVEDECKKQFNKKFQKIVFKPLSRDQIVKFFNYQLEEADKQKLVDRSTLAEHKIFDIINTTFLIEKIVYQFDETVSLDELYQFYHKNSKSLVSNKEAIVKYCEHLLETFPEKQKLEKNIIFMLSLLPAGFSTREFQQICQIYKTWFGEFSNLQFSNYSQKQKRYNFDYEPKQFSEIQFGGKTANEKTISSYLDMFYVNSQNNFEEKKIFKIDRDLRQAVFEIFQRQEYLQKNDGQVSKRQLISITIEFMGSQARSILKSIIKQNKKGGQIDYRLVTAHLDCGMWWRYPNEEEHNEIISQPKERFQSYYFTNFKNLLEEDFLLENFPEIWNVEKVSQESEYIFDLCQTLPSILIELNRFDEAEEIISHCKKFNNGKGLLLHGILDLMSASITVYKESLSSKQNIKQGQSHQSVSDLLNNARSTFELLKDDEGQAEAYYVESLLLINQFRISSNVQDNLIHYKKMEEFEKIQKFFSTAYQLFGKVNAFDSPQNCNHIFGKAKVLLASTEFFIQNHTYHVDLFDEYLEKAIEAEELFRARESMNFVAKTICLQAQLIMIKAQNQKLNLRVGILEAKNTIEKAVALINEIFDDAVVDLIKGTKDQIIKDMRQSSKNLFTFAKAFPIVRIEEDGRPTPINEYITSQFELATKIRRNFEARNIEVQLMFDNLNFELLDTVAEFGTRVLHITSDSYDSQKLYMEGENCTSQILECDKIYNYFMKQLKQDNNGPKLQNKIDCIVLAIPYSQKLGEQFKMLKVSHIVTFDFDQGDHVKDDLMPFRYNYIYAFCTQFYTQLVQETTVLDAFNSALAYVQDIDNAEIWQLIWEHKDRKFCDLGITPILLDKDNPIHKEKFYDTNADKNNKRYLQSPGEIHDISKPRCQNTNIKKHKDPFIGNQTELYLALKYLTSEDQVKHLVHIQGKHYVGKTRLMEEIAYKLLQRSKFQYKIWYINTETIQTEQQFKDMLTDCQLFNTLNKSLKTQQQSTPILILFDNIDKLGSEVNRIFETRLVDLVERNSGIRFITSSRRTFQFKQFKPSEDSQAKSKVFAPTMARLVMKPLDEINSVDLLVSFCQKEITQQELGLSKDDKMSVHRRLQLEPIVCACKGLPLYLIELGKALYQFPFNEIQLIEEEPDSQKQTPVHHKAKPRQKIKFVHKLSHEEQISKKQNSNKKEKEKNKNTLSFMHLSAMELTPAQNQNDSIYQQLLVISESENQTPETRSRVGSQFVPATQDVLNTNEMTPLLNLIEQQQSTEEWVDENEHSEDELSMIIGNEPGFRRTHSMFDGNSSQENSMRRESFEQLNLAEQFHQKQQSKNLSFRKQLSQTKPAIKTKSKNQSGKQIQRFKKKTVRKFTLNSEKEDQGTLEEIEENKSEELIDPEQEQESSPHLAGNSPSELNGEKLKKQASKKHKKKEKEKAKAAKEEALFSKESF